MDLAVKKAESMKIEDLDNEMLGALADSLHKGPHHGETFRGLLESNLDFARWGFRLSHTAYREKGPGATLIYDSDRCRVRFDLANPERYPIFDELYVRYGRLHAPNDDAEMIWRGEKCRCWHSPMIELLPFLEGQSVEEVFRCKAKVGKYARPPFLEAYKQSEESHRLRSMYPPAAVIREERLIWEHCGDRLFDVFDLRRPELWEKNRRFVHDYWTEHDRLLPPRPILGDQPLPRDKIC